MADYNCSNKRRTAAVPSEQSFTELHMRLFARIWKVSGQVCLYSSKLLSSELVHDIFQPVERRNMPFTPETVSVSGS